MDFSELAQFFTHALKNTNPLITSAGSQAGESAKEIPIFKLIIDSFTKLGNLILNEDP